MNLFFQTFAAALIGLTVVSASADLLVLQAGPNNINNVNVATAATTQVNGAPVSLTAVGAGLRSEKVLFVNVPVYVGELYLDQPSTMSKDPNQVLASFASDNVTAFQMSFVHAATSDQVMSAFQDGFTANNIDATAAPYAALLSQVSASGSVSIGQVITFVLNKNSDGTETLQYEDQNGKVTTLSGPSGLTENILSLWMGQSTDAGVAALKASILKGL